MYDDKERVAKWRARQRRRCWSIPSGHLVGTKAFPSRGLAEGRRPGACALRPHVEHDSNLLYYSTNFLSNNYYPAKRRSSKSYCLLTTIWNFKHSITLIVILCLEKQPLDGPRVLKVLLFLSKLLCVVTLCHFNGLEGEKTNLVLYIFILETEQCKKCLRH